MILIEHRPIQEQNANFNVCLLPGGHRFSKAESFKSSLKQKKINKKKNKIKVV